MWELFITDTDLWEIFIIQCFQDWPIFQEGEPYFSEIKELRTGYFPFFLERVLDFFVAFLALLFSLLHRHKDRTYCRVSV